MLFDYIIIILGFFVVGFIILAVRLGWIKVDIVFKKDVDALCGKKD